MSDIQEQPVRPLGEELDDFDVEGHGLREVALGLSAATVVATGAGVAAIAMDNPLPGTTGGVNAVVTGVSADAKDRAAWALRTTDTTTAGAVQDAGRAVDRATTVLVGVVTPAVGTATDVVDTATGTAGDVAAQATDLAGEAVADPVGTTDRLVDDALAATREVRDGAVATADRTADRAVTIVAQTAGDAVETAGSAADGAVTTATGAAGDVYDTADPRAEVDRDGDGTTVTVGAAGKTVVVSTS